MKGSDIFIAIGVIIAMWIGALLIATYGTSGGAGDNGTSTGGWNPSERVARQTRQIKPQVNTRTGSRSSGARMDRSTEEEQEIRRSVFIDSVRAVRDPIDKHERDMAVQPEDTENIVLRASRNNTVPVSITGWHLESRETGVRVSIGKASVIHPDSFSSEPVILGPGHSAVITTGEGPSTGLWPHDEVSFRLTKCSGYLTNHARYRPRIPRQCPDPEDHVPDDIRSEHLCMEEVIEEAGRCSQPQSIPDFVSSECREWVRNNITLNGCRKRHRGDEDFLRDEWRIFLDREDAIWDPDHEIIDLINEDGEVVDTYYNV